MRVRNALIKPEFVMFYLTFPLERAVELCGEAGFGTRVEGLGWEGREEAVLVEAIAPG